MILNILLFSFLFDRYYKMVSPQNGDTRGGQPPLATPLITLLIKRGQRIQSNNIGFIQAIIIYAEECND